MIVRTLSVVTVWAILVITICPAEELAATPNVKRRTFTESDVKQGKQSINALCSRCHGRDGKGAKGPDLTDGQFKRARSDEEIIEIISNGISGTGMAGMGSDYVDYYWPIVAYMRAAAATREPTVAPPPGDVVRGYQLFKSHQCVNCHWTGNEGGRKGVDLSQLTATADYIRQSMKDPDSQIDGTHQQVILLDQIGNVLTGQRLSENTYSILLMDGQENLRSIDKSNLEQISRPQQSIMPRFDDKLSEQDIADITTYLFSINKATNK